MVEISYDISLSYFRAAQTDNSIVTELSTLTYDSSAYRKIIHTLNCNSFKDLKYGIPYPLILKQLQAFILSNDWWNFF